MNKIISILKNSKKTNMNNIEKHVTFSIDKPLETVYIVESFTTEDIVGNDWTATFDLCYREFSLPIEKGGCNNDYNVLVEKVYQLPDPCMYYLGKKWQELQQ